MALSFFGGSSHAKYFDIRLNDSYIVFRGTEEEAASAHLKGTLVLCLTEPISIKYLKLRLTGMSRVCATSWHYPSSSNAGGRRAWKESVFYEKSWKFRDAGKGKTEILPADNYEFPFDVVLDGSLPESVEGLAETWVTYRFKAEIGRKYAKDIVVRKPLRIIRTLSAGALELSHAMSVDNVWPNKVEYSISTPLKAVIFGTSIRVDFRLIPLLKGLRIGKINSQLVESHDLTLNPEDPEPLRSCYKITRTIINDERELPNDGEPEIIDETAEGHQFTHYLDMPKTLTKCLQDTDTRGIKVRHKLKFQVQLLNPDGHISELRATLPVSVFISPNMPFDDNNNMVDQSPVAAQRAVDELAGQAPPLYGEHQFDQLYSEVDHAGYRTPGPSSGSATPFGALSRNISSENLASMNALTGNDISASLHSRLSNLHANSGRPSPDPRTDRDRRHLPMTGDAAGGPPTSHPLSRSSSDEAVPGAPSGAATPRQPQYMEVESLSRVPSYSTAVRTTVQPCDAGLPNYQTVIAGDIVTPPVPQSPQQAHIRARQSPPDNLDRSLPFHSRALGETDDSERRLRLVQARAR
ncbi:hypothetical protein PHISCL_08322 [Aspergillus sclerotialis]|uniref:Carbon catabolite repressor D n=1 Tax=Aspergillus sclerotialis TaxID=2070753 RepID=A0A3A2Z9R5_9EURO|nr:hypothetical protein PHISCL_08322 [Aspergillus sclerotialis]